MLCGSGTAGMPGSTSIAVSGATGTGAGGADAGPAAAVLIGATIGDELITIAAPDA